MKKSMIQRLGCLVASISFAFVGATAFANEWFTAKKSDGQLLDGDGTWSMDNASWNASAQTYNNFTTPLKFTATESRSNIVSITTSVKFTAKDELLASEIAGAKGGLAVLENEDSTATNYYGVVSGEWVQLAGVAPDLTRAVEVSISLFSVGKPATNYINYSIDGTALTYGSKADIPTTCAGDGSIKSVEYLGKCELASLSGATADPYVAQDGDGKYYAAIPSDKAVTIVNPVEYNPTARAMVSCNLKNPYNFLAINPTAKDELAGVGLKVATLNNGDVVIRPNFTSNNGDGTSAATAWEIGSEADLDAFRLGVENKKFGGAGQYFKQTQDFALANVFPGIGYTSFESYYYDADNGTYSAHNVSPKDCVSFTIGVKKENVKAVDGTNRWEYFKSNAFGGTYDGQGHKITGVKIPGGDYTGFFNCAYKATIKDLSIGIADSGLVTSSGNTAGLFVGVARECTLSGLTALEGNFETGKDAASIVAYMAGGTVQNCTNNMNVTFGTSTNRKGGGLVLITQWGNTLEAAGTAKIINCVNKGKVKSNTAAANGIGGILGYEGMTTVINGCEFTGTLDAPSGSLSGSIVGHVDKNLLSGTGNKTTVTDKLALGQNAADGFNFATVSGDGVTFVNNSDLVAGGSYKVMASIAAPASNITLAQGQLIAFDNALYKTFDATTNIVAAVPASTKITSATSGTVTTFTCAEKAKATVSITMNGATATVKAGGANIGETVYEGTEITISDLAVTDAEKYENPTASIMVDGVAKLFPYTTTADDQAIVIEIKADESKIVPIDPAEDPGLPKMDVNKEAFPEMSAQQIKAYLKEEQKNGQPGWVNYALGIGDTANDKPFLADRGSAGSVVIDLGNAGIAPADSGITSKIVQVMDGGDDVEIVNGEIELDDADTETATMKVALVLYDKDNNPTKVVEKEVGVEKTAVECDEGMDSVILSVPFTDMAEDMAEGSVSVANLIKAKNLEIGDRLSVYNASKGMNEGWNWSGKAWAPDNEDVGSAAAKFLKPGEGVWFTPKTKTARNLFKFGAYSATKTAVEVKNDNWALIANPHLSCEAEGGVVALDKLITSPTVNDEFQVETATTPVIFTYEGGSWGYNEVKEGKEVRGKKIRTVQRNIDTFTIQPGKGLWYGNGNAETKSVKW